VRLGDRLLPGAEGGWAPLLSTRKYVGPVLAYYTAVRLAIHIQQLLILYSISKSTFTLPALSLTCRGGLARAQRSTSGIYAR